MTCSPTKAVSRDDVNVVIPDKASRPTGRYKGPIKSLPTVSVKLYGYYRSYFPNLHRGCFHHQCGVNILAGFPIKYTGVLRENNRIMTAEQQRDCLLHNVSKEIDKYQKEGGYNGSKGSYIMATLNKQQYELGIGEDLEDYFGFELLETPFINRPHERDKGGSAIFLYGLCTYKFIK